MDKGNNEVFQKTFREVVKDITTSQQYSVQDLSLPINLKYNYIGQ